MVYQSLHQLEQFLSFLPLSSPKKYNNSIHKNNYSSEKDLFSKVQKIQQINGVEDVKLFGQMMNMLYVFQKEIVELRKKCNHYTEALLKSTIKKNNLFLEEYEQNKNNNNVEKN